MLTSGSILELPQFSTNKPERAARIAETRRYYQYDHDDPLARGMPPWMRGVPKPERWYARNPGVLLRLIAIGSKLLTNWTVGAVRLRWRHARVRAGHAVGRRSPDPYAMYTDLYRGRDRPWVTKDHVWKTDEAFGYQRLAGLAPFYLERVTAIPDDFKVTDAHLVGVPAWPERKTISDMIAARRLWMVRHPEVSSVANLGPGRPLCSPHTLFLVRDDQRLVPVAIQLFKDSDVIFTPKDDIEAGGRTTNRWLVAKMFSTHIDALVCALFSHATLTHMLIGAWWGAACRNLSDRHPIRAFITPHAEVTHFSNDAQRSLTSRKGTLIRLHQAGYERSWALLRGLYGAWSFADLDIPRLQARRGWDTPDEPPNFAFRDDSLKHYQLLEEHCRSVCSAIYPDDETVAADYELQAWVRELADPIRGCGLRGLPTEEDGTLTTRVSLVKLLAGPIYQAVVTHSHIDNTAFTYWSFRPNLPLSLDLEPPRDHCVTYTDEEIAAGLSRDFVLQFALASANHPIHPRPRSRWFTSSLAEYPEDYMVHLPEDQRDKVHRAIATWRAELEAYAQLQDRRDERLGPMLGTVLNSRNMSNSIWS